MTGCLVRPARCRVTVTGPSAGRCVTCRGRPGAVFDRRELGVAGCGCRCRGSGRSPSLARRRRRSGRGRRCSYFNVPKIARGRRWSARLGRGSGRGAAAAHRRRTQIGRSRRENTSRCRRRRRSERDDVDDLAGVLVHQFELAMVVPQVVQAENAFGLVDGRVETRERIDAAAGRGDPGGEAVLGGVVDDCADAPDPTARCSNSLKLVCQTRLRSVGGSRNTLRRNAAQDLRSARNPSVGAHHRGDLAVAPRRPVGRVLRRRGLGRINGRRRPRPLHRRIAASERGQAVVVGALRNAGQGGEPRDRQLGCRSQGAAAASRPAPGRCSCSRSNSLSRINPETLPESLTHTRRPEPTQVW